jgi:hypothetical protein
MRRRACAQAFEGIGQILLAGTDSVLQAMEMYTKRAWVLRAWQDVFVDLVQGQLQQLFLSLLSRAPIPLPSAYYLTYTYHVVKACPDVKVCHHYSICLCLTPKDTRYNPA